MKTMSEVWARIDRRGPDECWEWQGARNPPMGHGRVSYCGRMTYVHRLIVNAPEGSVVRHDCDNPPCCNPAHLKVGTQADNLADMARRGRSTAGERNPNAKLNSALVQGMRLMRATGFSLKMIAAQYNVAVPTVSMVCNYKTWVTTRSEDDETGT